MVDLVFKASESTVPQMEIYRYLYSRCKILLAFCWYQYFDNLNFLSGFYLSKTRGRSAFFRENYNLNTVIIYGIRWNFHWWWNRTFWTRLWPKICVQYFYLGSNRKKVYHFAWALILDKDCMKCKILHAMHWFESNKTNNDLCMQEYLLLLI